MAKVPGRLDSYPPFFPRKAPFPPSAPTTDTPGGPASGLTSMTSCFQETRRQTCPEYQALSHALSRVTLKGRVAASKAPL